MIFYCVITSYHDNGKVTAYITDHAANDGILPENKMKSYKDKDTYWDYFADKKEAIKFCDEAKMA